MAILYPPFLQQSGFSVAILGTLIALDGVGRLLSACRPGWPTRCRGLGS